MSIEVPSGAVFEAITSYREFFRSVVQVYEQTADEGGQPGSDVWLCSEKYSDIAFQKVLAAWAELTGLDDWRFPYSRDAVRQAWEAYRKAKSEQCEQMRNWVGIKSD